MSAEADTGQAVRRIAVWSGPRNISTALMRAFANRVGAVAVDEPFYGVYLAATGLDHPMREEVLGAMPTDPDEAVERLFAPLPAGKTLQYQKHMTHHMVPGVSRDWFGRVDHVFLIRRPEDVLASYAAKREEVALSDIGFFEQLMLFQAAREATGRMPVVVDGRAVQADPAAVLRRLCAALSIEFDPAMLAWRPGPRPEDGVWARHWYGAVQASTGFRPPRPPLARDDLPDALRDIAASATPFYETLKVHALTP